MNRMGLDINLKKESNQWRLASLICPKNEMIWESLWSSDIVLKYIITSNRNRDTYLLYSVGNKMELTLVGKAKTPMDIHRKFLNGGWSR